MKNLYTKDDIKLDYNIQQNGFDSIIVVCPGFFNSKQNRWMQKTVDLLSDDYDTLVFDFRGHGKSRGKFSWLAKEHLDLEAILDFVSSFNYKSIGILGYSLGAAATVNAVSRRDGVKGIILISCPYSFWKIDYHFWEPEMLSDLRDNFECNWEGKGAKLDNMFMPKRKPITEIKKIKSIPIFFIHGSRDWIIKDYHSRKLYEAAKCSKKIEIIKDGLHAERLVQKNPEKMKKLFLNWFNSTLIKEAQ